MSTEPGPIDDEQKVPLTPDTERDKPEPEMPISSDEPAPRTPGRPFPDYPE